jgi:hypothetical protein
MMSTDCLICGGSTFGRPASIAAFVVVSCGLESDRTEIRHCPSCEFAFFSRRLTDAEAARLYSGYRGVEYNARRLSVEPSYAPLIPIFDDPLSDYYVERIREYTDVMDIYPEIEPATVLDFGGDGSVPARVFPAATVTFDDLSAGTGGPAAAAHDLVFASQVFEHVSAPLNLLRGLAGRLAPEGVLFIDLPKEYNGSLAEGLLLQERHGGALYTMHEHINHFSRRSLRRMVEASGLEPFFEISPFRHRTLLVLAGHRGSNVVRRFAAERTIRTQLWNHVVLRQMGEWAQAEARGAHFEARAAHAYGREISQRRPLWRRVASRVRRVFGR